MNHDRHTEAQEAYIYLRSARVGDGCCFGGYVMSILITLELLLALLLWGPVEVESKVDQVEQVETYHFFYSYKQDKQVQESLSMMNKPRRMNEVFIGGKFIRYTEAVSNKSTAGRWDDYQYLGSAPKWYIRTNGKIQHADLRDGI